MDLHTDVYDITLFTYGFYVFTVETAFLIKIVDTSSL